MKSVVWKFTLAEGRQAFGMPAGAKILGVHAQHDGIFMWAQVSLPSPDLQRREFMVLMTGQETDVPLGEFIGSVFFSNNSYVLHVFEVERGESLREG